MKGKGKTSDVGSGPNPATEMVDMTPSRHGYAKMCLLIMRQSRSPKDKAWAESEILRLVGNRPWGEG